MNDSIVRMTNRACGVSASALRRTQAPEYAGNILGLAALGIVPQMVKVVISPSKCEAQLAERSNREVAGSSPAAYRSRVGNPAKPLFVLMEEES